MTLETAAALLNILSCNIGKVSENGDIVKALLIVPSDNNRRKEYLKLYRMNQWSDGGMIRDCYANEQLTIIFVFQGPKPLMRYQDIKQFLLKKTQSETFG